MSARSRIRITRSYLDRLKPEGGKTKYHWDCDLRGFGVAVSGRTGDKTYVVQTGTRIPRRVVERADRITLEQARIEAAEMLVLIGKGIDPKKVQPPKAPVAVVTLGEVLNRMLKNKKRLSATTADGYRYTAEHYLKDWLNLPLTSITKPMTRQLHTEIKERIEGKTGRKDRGGTAANEALKLVLRLWNHAEREDMVENLPRNPVRFLEWYRLTPKARYIPDTVLRAFYQAVMTDANSKRRDKKHSRDIPPNVVAQDLVVFSLFTGMRMGELSHLRWENVDRDLGLIQQPHDAELNKSKRDWELPLTDFTRDLIARRWELREAGSPYVFPAQLSRHHHDGPQPSGRPNALLDRLATAGTLPAPVPRYNPHALRHTYITAAANAGVEDRWIKRLVNHSEGKDMTARYTHTERENLRAKAQLVTDYLKRCIGLPIASKRQSRHPRPKLVQIA